MKLPLTKEELYERYNKYITQLVEDCDWISVISSEQVSYFIHKSLFDVGVEISPDKIDELYSNKTHSLNLTTEEWCEQYGSDVPKIIGLIYDAIEEYTPEPFDKDN